MYLHFLLTHSRKLLPIFCVFVCLCIDQLFYIISQPKFNKTKLKQQTSIISHDSLGQLGGGSDLSQHS